MARILVVDDAPHIADVVRACLEREGHIHALRRAPDSHLKNLRRQLGIRPDGNPYVATIHGLRPRGARG